MSADDTPPPAILMAVAGALEGLLETADWSALSMQDLVLALKCADLAQNLAKRVLLTTKINLGERLRPPPVGAVDIDFGDVEECNARNIAEAAAERAAAGVED